MNGFANALLLHPRQIWLQILFNHWSSEDLFCNGAGNEHLWDTLCSCLFLNLNFRIVQISFVCFYLLLLSVFISFYLYLFYQFFYLVFISCFWFTSFLSVIICFYLFVSVCICFYLFLSVCICFFCSSCFICFYLLYLFLSVYQFYLFLLFQLFYLFLSIYLFMTQSQVLFSSGFYLFISFICFFCFSCFICFYLLYLFLSVFICFYLFLSAFICFYLYSAFGLFEGGVSQLEIIWIRITKWFLLFMEGCKMKKLCVGGFFSHFCWINLGEVSKAFTYSQFLRNFLLY